MKKDTRYETIQVWKSTKKKLRHLHAETGKTIVQLIDDLVECELERVINEDEKKEDEK